MCESYSKYNVILNRDIVFYHPNHTATTNLNINGKLLGSSHASGRKSDVIFIGFFKSLVYLPCHAKEKAKSMSSDIAFQQGSVPI